MLQAGMFGNSRHRSMIGGAEGRRLSTSGWMALFVSLVSQACGQVDDRIARQLAPGDGPMKRELMQKGLDLGWSLARFTGFTIDELRLYPMEDRSQMDFSRYSLDGALTAAPGGRAVVGTYSDTRDRI